MYKKLKEIISLRLQDIKKNISYTQNHKIAFLRVEKELLGKNTFSGYLHDIDKLFLYLLFSKKCTHKIHIKFAKHHVKNAKVRKDYIQMIIDWECARFTKPDKPLNARQTLAKFYPELTDTITPILNEFNL